MSAHSSFVNWHVEQDLPEGFAEEVAGCVEMNLKIRPMAFATICPADKLVMACGVAREEELAGKPVTVRPEEGNSWCVSFDAVMKVLRKNDNEGKSF